MIRRIIVLALWTYFAWYLVAMLAAYTAGPSVAGPIAAMLTAVAGIVGLVRVRRRETRPRRPLSEEIAA